MKHAAFILLLIVFLLFSSGCSESSAITDPGTVPSITESSAPIDGVPAEGQADAVSNTSLASSTAVSTPAASASPAVSSQGSGGQAAGSDAAIPGAPGPTPITHEITLLPPLPPIPAYTTEENILSNTLVTTYHGERLRSIHALDVKNHLTARYHIATTMSIFGERDFAALLENANATPKAADRAFILFTDQGRYYIYLDESAPPELNAIWETVYSKDAPKIIHWLTHMTTSKIIKISFSGWSRNAGTSIGLTVEDSATIADISDFLKNSLTVNAKRPIEVIDAMINPSTVASAYSLSIKFDNGIDYFLLGYGDYGDTDAGGSGIHISTSDLEKTIFYMLNAGAAGHLRDFMEQKQLEYWQENGYPTRMNVKILPATSVTEKLVYSKDLSVPLHITNNSEKAITVATDFVTRWRPLVGGEMAYVSWGEGYSGEFSERIPAGGNAVVWIPFSGFDLPKDGRGKYQTEFWVDGKFKIIGSYVVT